MLDSEQALSAARRLAATDPERLWQHKTLPLQAEPLLRHSDLLVRIEAVFLLGKLQLHYKAIDPVFVALSHQDRYDRDHQDLQILQRLLRSDPRSPEFLLEALDNRIGYVRYQAACCLGWLDYPSWHILNALDESLEDDNLRVREAAQKSLKRLQRPLEPDEIKAIDTGTQNNRSRMGFLELEEP